MYTKVIARIIKDRSYTMYCIVWACHLYPVAVGALLAAQGVTYKKFRLLILLRFPLI